MSPLSIRHNIEKASASLQQGDADPRVEVEILLAEVLNVSRTYLYTWPEKELNQAQLVQFNDFVERRKCGEPIAYIVGHREFWSLDLSITKDVLIPRHETELLVEIILQSVSCSKSCRILEVGTGSGAIALALAKECVAWQVVASDYSAKALALAKHNADRYQLHNVNFVQSDLFDAFTRHKFDLIVSNPPYLAAADPHLRQGDLRFEPRQALVAEQEGMAILSKLIEQAQDYLTVGGLLILEHGFNQASLVRESFKQHGYQGVHTYRDLQDHERATVGIK